MPTSANQFQLADGTVPSRKAAVDASGNVQTNIAGVAGGVTVPVSVASLPTHAVSITGGALSISGTLPTTLADLSGNNLKIGPKGNLFASLGGNTKGTAASNATTTLLTGAGQGGYALVTTTGSGIATIYDNTAGSGTVVAVVAANATAGTLIPIPFPLSTGLTVVSAASGPALTVTWTQ